VNHVLYSYGVNIIYIYTDTFSIHTSILEYILIRNVSNRSIEEKREIMQQQAPSAIIQQYRELIMECQKIQGKISELEVDRAEHILVEETLRPLDPKRRAFRLVGECLVERTVEEVLPTVAANRENVRAIFNISSL
jgi:prefoldin subunit 2